MRLTLVVFAVVAVLGGGATADAGRADEDLLLIESDRSGLEQLYLVSTDGRAIRRLADPRRSTELLAVSPDGRRIVYAEYGEGGVYLVGSNGKGRIRLGTTFEAEGAWNPGGSLYALAGAASIAIFDRAGKRQRLALDASGGSVTWSPDGRSIAFTTEEGRVRIDRARGDGTGRRSFLRGDSSDSFDPAWSPDGRRIAYARAAADGAEQIVVADAEGRNAVRLTPSGTWSTSPAWSPDGAWIAHARADGEEGAAIWVMRSDGMQARRLTKGFVDDRPAWSADGRSILFDRELEDEENDLYRVKVMGGPPRRVSATAVISQAAPLPLGERFVATVRRGRKTALGLFSSRGSLLRLLTTPDADSEPAVSPDGATIAFVRNERIATMPSTGGRARFVTRGDEPEHAPAWGPDGLSFAVGPSTGLAVLDLQTMRRRTLARDAVTFSGDVSWSASGEIAYTLRYGIRIRSRRGAVLGTYRTDTVGGPDWSPDGTYLAVFEVGGTAFLRTDTTVARRLHTHSWWWHPDGHRVVWQSSRGLRVTDLATGRSGAFRRVGGKVTSGASFRSDGRRVAFDVARLPGLATDVYVAGSSGAAPRRVTSAFPDGGSNVVAGWARGPRPAPAGSPAATLLLPRKVARVAYVHDLHGGDRIVYVAGPAASPETEFPGPRRIGMTVCRSFHVLESGHDRRYEPCRGDSALLGAAASSRGVAWVLFHSDEGIGDEDGACLYALAGRVTDRGQRGKSRACDPSAPGPDPVSTLFGGVLGPIEAAGALMVMRSPIYDSDTETLYHELVRIDGRTLTTIVRTRASVDLLGVDSTRVAALLGGGTVVVYRGDGAVLRMLPFQRGTVLDAALDEDGLVVLRPGAIERYHLATGLRLARLGIRRGFAAPPTLHGAARGRAAYVVGTLLHVVRFADRTDRAYRIDDVVPPVHAALTRSGLYVGVNRSIARPAGLVGYVPVHEP